MSAPTATKRRPWQGASASGDGMAARFQSTTSNPLTIEARLYGVLQRERSICLTSRELRRLRLDVGAPSRHHVERAYRGLLDAGLIEIGGCRWGGSMHTRLRAREAVAS